MIAPKTLRLVAAALTLIVTGGAAIAQSDACRSYRAELSAMGRGGGGGSQRAYAEAASQYAAYGCNRGGFFGAPPQCASIAQQMRSAQQAYYGGGSSYSEGRRQQLIAAVAAYCGSGDESLRRISSPEEEADKRARRERERRAKAEGDDGRGAVGGSRMVCVRACDGFFFPVNNVPDGKGGANEMCQALCPGAPTAAYRMPLDGEIQQAVSMTGRAYSALPAALRYQKGADASCACRAKGQSWTEALRRAEGMIDRKKGDIYVTAAKAEELSRPKMTRLGKKVTVEFAKSETPKGPMTAYTSTSIADVKKSATDTETAAALTAPVPTDGKQSAGIGPKVIEGEKALAKDVGPKKDVEDEEGLRKTVRVIAPGIVAVPQNALP